MDFNSLFHFFKKPLSMSTFPFILVPVLLFLPFVLSNHLFLHFINIFLCLSLFCLFVFICFSPSFFFFFLSISFYLKEYSVLSHFP